MGLLAVGQKRILECSIILFSLAVPISLCYLLLAHCQSLCNVVISTGLLTVPVSFYYTLMAYLQSVCHSSILYWPTDSPYVTLIYSNEPLSLYHSTILYWPTDSPFITLTYTIGQLTVHSSLFYTLLVH